MSKRKPIKLEWERVPFPYTTYGPLEFEIRRSHTTGVKSRRLFTRLKMAEIDLHSFSVRSHKTIPAAKRAAVRICERLRDSIPPAALIKGKE